MTTIENITDEQIQALSDEAAQHGDLDMAEDCNSALRGDDEARANCVRAIRDAEAQH